MIDSNYKFDIKTYKNEKNNNGLIVLVCCIWCILAPFLFYHSSGTFGVRGSISPLYEYTIIFVVLGLYYTGKNSRYIFLIFIASLFWVLHGFLSGERVAALEVLIVWIVFLALEKLTPIRIIFGSFLGIFLLTLIGITRGFAALDSFSLSDLFAQLIETKFANDTSYYSYQASTVLYLFEGMNTLYDRIGYLIRWLIYIFAGSRINKYNIAWEAVTGTGLIDNGGGWVMFYSHFWLGFAGVFFMAMYLAYIINRAQKHLTNSTYSNCSLVYFVATSPRWYLYSPALVMRGLLFFWIISLAFQYFNNSVSK